MKALVLVSVLTPFTFGAALRGLSTELETLSAEVSPAVVEISASGYGPLNDGGPTKVSVVGRRRTAGSGVIVDPEGYILTNAHVVANTQRVRVSITEKDKPHGAAWVDAKVIGQDEETDLALLKIERQGLPALEFGNSDKLRQGQMVVALGNPMGLANSMTMGVLSSAQRQLREEDPMTYLQTDAPINPGNSGGPLVDLDGKLIGINTFILTQSGGSEGLGFAIPSNMAFGVYNQLKANGRVLRGEIGAVMQNMTPGIAAGLGLQQTWGAIVTDVTEKGAAHAAGLRVRDVVTSLDGKPIENATQFAMGIFRHRAGEFVDLGVVRDGKDMQIRSAVLARNDGPSQLAKKVSAETNLVPQIGLLCVDVDETTMQMMPGLRRPYGVIIAARAPSVSSQQTPLQQGDVVYAINGKLIPDLKTFRNAMAGFQPGDAVIFEVERPGKLSLVEFEWE
ncbi:MAG TPA: trypsin-like peptidase domain-containing protein [Bryobacteraceae bacterium]|nr:trypsin-like peptidase domain-containing protein [Bryobacteraceae bacterium]